MRTTVTTELRPTAQSVAFDRGFALDKNVIERRYGIDFDHRFAAELRSLEPLAEDGLVDLLPGRIEVTPRGRFIVRNVAMAFDAYLGKQPDVQYSRTV